MAARLEQAGLRTLVLERRGNVAVGLNGQSGAEWAGHTIAFYRIDGRSVVAEQRVFAGG